MPDHAHFIIQPGVKEEDKDGNPIFWPLSDILHSIKSYSAKEVNKLENVTGTFWQEERYDRYMRSDLDLEEKFHYVCRNPWAAGVVKESEPWPWLWTPDIEAWKPYVATSARKGSTGDSPVPVGDPPTGMGAATAALASADLKTGIHSHSAGQVAQQDGRVARATQIQVDVAFRVIADHNRTLSFSIADGILPGNNDRNYVLRRILRRAVRYGRTLGFHEPFFYKLVDVLADTMGDVFPEIRARQQVIKDVLQTEEEAFNKTLDRGIELFEGEVIKRERSTAGWQETMKSYSNASLISHSSTFAHNPETKETFAAISSDGLVLGKFAFTLYDTYGFPFDLTELMARERGLTVDKAGFDKLMEEQKSRARAAQKKEVISLSQIETTTPTKFVGFERLQTSAKVLEVVSVKDNTGVILDVSAAYAEMGGQVGDTGEISGAGQLWRVANTQKTGNTFLHFLAEKDAPAVGAEIQLSVDAARRGAIQRHHTVTHLLHWALHEVASREASQKGSFVGPDKLTFDFNSAPLTAQQVADIEKLVNERILENAGVSWTEVPHAEVKQRKDVMQFFGDKYGEVVRVVQIGGEAGKLNGYSMELCGGTHTRATGEIGLFRIVSEAAVAAGVRRIEAVAGLAAYQTARQEAELIRAVAGKVSAPVAELEKKIESLLAQQRELEKSLRAANQKEAAGKAKELLARATSVGAEGMRAIVENLGAADGDYLQAVADALKGEFKGVVVLGGATGGAVSLVATVSADFTAKVQAGKIIQAIAPIVGGKGGGKPDNARGGGKDVGKLNEALVKAKEMLK